MKPGNFSVCIQLNITKRSHRKSSFNPWDIYQNIPKQVSGNVITVRDDIVIQVVKAWNEEEIANLYRAAGGGKRSMIKRSYPVLFWGVSCLSLRSTKKPASLLGWAESYLMEFPTGISRIWLCFRNTENTGIGARIVATLVKNCV